MDNVDYIINKLKNHVEHVHLERSPIPFEKLFKQVLSKEPRLIFYIYSYNVSSVSLKYDIDFKYNKDLPDSIDDIIIDNGTFSVLDYHVIRPLKLRMITLNVEDLYQRLESDFGEYSGRYEGLYAYQANSCSMKQFTAYEAVTVTFSYVLSLERLVVAQKAARKKANEIAYELTRNVTTPPAIKVYLAMSYLHQNVTYDYEAFEAVTKDSYRIVEYPFSQIAYGPFLENKAVCVGISHAFKYLMDAFNIECDVICGNVGGSGKVDHAWNLVKINRQYFHVDVTYNIGEGMSIHSFMKDDKHMKEYQWNHDKYPRAIGIHYNYDFIEDWLEDHGQELIDAGIDVQYIYPNIIEKGD